MRPTAANHLQAAVTEACGLLAREQGEKGIRELRVPTPRMPALGPLSASAKCPTTNNPAGPVRKQGSSFTIPPRTCSHTLQILPHSQPDHACLPHPLAPLFPASHQCKAPRVRWRQHPASRPSLAMTPCIRSFDRWTDNCSPGFSHDQLAYTLHLPSLNCPTHLAVFNSVFMKHGLQALCRLCICSHGSQPQP